MSVTKASRKSRKEVLKQVPFELRAEARKVILTGDFTGWSPEGIRMSPAAPGEWKAVVELAPGEYQYRLVVDDIWTNDPSSSRRVANPFGTENDVRIVS